MKDSFRITWIVIVLVSQHFYANSQRAIHKTTRESHIEIEAINNTIEQLYLTENINSLISWYTGPLTFFPEYRPAIFEITRLKVFFNDWFNAGDIKAYKKKIHTIEMLSDHILEIGTFNLNYSSFYNPQGEFSGKYMILWKRDNKGKLSIVSEAFGADKYIEPEVVPYAAVQIEAGNFIPDHKNISRELLSEIEESNAIVIKAVAEGDGDARAKGFTEDAILMSNFDSISVGMEVIRPKMLKTYKPGTSYIVKHTYSWIYDLGDYVFINGHYKGGPANSPNGGGFEGKMSNVMKRNEHGKLLMHRQMVNRDRK